MGFPGGADGKESACNVSDPGPDTWVRTIPWRREWHPTPLFLPGESHGQRSLEGCSPWGHKELDTTEQLTKHHEVVGAMIIIFPAEEVQAQRGDIFAQDQPEEPKVYLNLGLSLFCIFGP